MKKNLSVFLVSAPSGFTLIELLIVIVILAALTVVVFIALNPVKRQQDPRNARRAIDIQSILSAIHEYIIDNKSFPTGLTAGMQETQLGTSNGSGASGNPSCVIMTGGCIVTATACVDLSGQLAPYLKSIPVDPSMGTAAETHYSVTVNTNNIITVKACGAEGQAAGASPLTWSPPTCGDTTHGCVDLSLADTGSHQSPSLSSSNDYRIHLPSVPLRGGLTISGGHNVIIIGGEIDLTTPCDDSSSACHGIYIKRGSASGSVFLEGIYIKNPDATYSHYTGDGIDVNDYPGVTDVTMENVRVGGIDGCDPTGDPAAHADVFQPYNAGGAKLHVDHFTGTTDCQGFQVDPDYAWSATGTTPVEGIFNNVNINVFANPHTGNNNRYAWWFVDSNNPCVGYPTTLVNDYTQEPNGTLSINSVWPDTNQPSSCKSVWSAASKTLSFPIGTQITGVMNAGLPPGGDFVPVGTAGIGYASPGYTTSIMVSQ
jgi:prepilin-type N-terminal cleavage/methylation domain-containing protein